MTTGNSSLSRAASTYSTVSNTRDATACSQHRLRGKYKHRSTSEDAWQFVIVRGST